ASHLVPVIANVRPSGDQYLMEDFYYAGGLPAMLARIGDRLHLDAMTVTGKTLGENIEGAEVFNDDVIRTVDNPIYAEGALVLRKDAIHIYRTSYVRDNAIRQRLHFTNHSSEDVKLAVSLVFDCDFSDIFEVRGMRREKRGTVNRQIQSPQSVIYAYKGLDDVVRRTTVHLDPEPVSLGETAALYYLHLAPKQSEKLYFAAVAESRHAAKPCSYVKGLRDAHRTLRRAEHETTSVSVSNSELDAVIKRATSDLRLLTTSTEDGPYPYAGTPWYSTTFGRDALITALQVLWLDPGMARGVLRRLARFQAQSHDADADAQPGKILHEMREGEMAALREIPFGRY
ncbi:MAG: dihydroxy-acid dehydratase, partial [Hyphomicrobium denitrificans]|nr:dihydroxy-acid dehydratase [Hyphomicrobium denitrificans]